MSQADLEVDPRFPSGPWTGFFLDQRLPGKHKMELHLSFQHGAMSGEGRDLVGQFTVRGRYDLADGKCYWHKRYQGRHDVFYQGFNEGKGIWGRWELTPREVYGFVHGGFHIWPVGMGDPTQETLKEQADLPATLEEAKEDKEMVGAP